MWDGDGIKVTMRRRPINRAMAAVVLMLLPLCVLVASCGRSFPPPKLVAAPKPAQTVNRVVTFQTPIGSRFAIVHHPVGAGTNAPLVVVMNGAYGTAQQAKASFGWDGMADRYNFVVAYPNASGPLWNAGNCCGAAHRNHVDDVGFLHALSLRMQTEDDIDPHRVFAVGLSNGAMMAYGWACARPGDLAGIGVVDGALVSSCSPAPAVEVVAVHGTADHNVPINGGVGQLSVTHYRYPSLTASIAPFVAGDGCGPSPRITRRRMVAVSTWTCSSDRNVVVAVVQGMGHIWPGARSSRPSTKQRLVRQTPIVLDATTFLWTNLRSSALG